MRLTRSLILAFVLLLVTWEKAAAQVDTSIVVALRDSIRKLQKSDSTLQAQLANAQIPNAGQILSITRRVADTHATFRITLNGIGRVVVRARNTAGNHMPEARSTSFAPEHVVRLENLLSSTDYTADVIVLRNDVAATESNVMRTGRAGANTDPQLAFRTSGPIGAPDLNAPPPSASAITPPTYSVPVTANQGVLIRGEIYRVVGGVRSQVPTDVDGPTFETDIFGQPTGTGFANSRTVAFNNLEGGATYQYIITAVNQQGKIDTLSTNNTGFDQITTGAPMPAFAFNDAVNVKIRPAEGLVVEWGTTVAPESASISAKFATIPGSFTRPATAVPGNPLRLQATIPTAALATALSAPTDSAPVITISMTRGGITRSLPFSVALEMPQQRNAINSIPGLNSNQKDSIKRVWDAVIAKSRDVPWRDMGVAALKVIGTAALE